MLVFLGEGKTGVPGEKPLAAEQRTIIEPGTPWWEACALTTAPSLRAPPTELDSTQSHYH